MIWTTEQVDTLTRLWGIHSGAVIAREIGHGATRNAIIGKAHRLGLPRLVEGRAQTTRRRKFNTAPARQTRIKFTGEPQGPGVRFPRDDFSRCAYIIADGICCGMKKAEASGFDMCAHHSALCLIPPDPKKAAKPFVVRAA